MSGGFVFMVISDVESGDLFCSVRGGILAKIHCFALDKEVDIPEDCRKGCPYFSVQSCQHPKTRRMIDAAGLLYLYFAD
jgi:hypothetical protein